MSTQKFVCPQACTVPSTFFLSKKHFQTEFLIFCTDDTTWTISHWSKPSKSSNCESSILSMGKMNGPQNSSSNFTTLLLILFVTPFPTMTCEDNIKMPTVTLSKDHLTVVEHGTFNVSNYCSVTCTFNFTLYVVLCCSCVHNKHGICCMFSSHISTVNTKWSC